ncbi:MAG: hypothetical protein ACRC3B_08485, partial [Bacteroidia bacterium]
MKTGILLTALLAIGINLQAQYYQQAYGLNCDVLNDGTPTTNGQNGHLMTGHTDAFSGMDLVLIRTDAGGAVTSSPTFNSGYRFYDVNTQLYMTPVEVLQESTTGDILVVGNYYPSLQSAQTELFITVSTPAGIITSAIRYTDPQFTDIRATRACLSIFNSSHIYVTGYVNSPPSNDFRPFIICYDWVGNTTVWEQVYDFVPNSADSHIPAAIICSPYGNEVAVVGTSVLLNDDQNVFYFRADQTNGSIIQSAPVAAAFINDVVILNGFSDGDEITAITTGFSSNNTTQGFVISGNRHSAPNSTDSYPWIFKIDVNGNILWANELVHGNGFSRIYDIIERQNTSGQFEYYLTGNAAAGYNTA